MRVLAKLYPRDDFADRATAMIADVVLLTVLLAGCLYWWHSAQPEHGQDALPQAVISPRDRGAQAASRTTPGTYPGCPAYPSP